MLKTDTKRNFFRWERNNMACQWTAVLYPHDDSPPKPRKGDEHMYGSVYRVPSTMNLDMCIAQYPAPTS